MPTLRPLRIPTLTCAAPVKSQSIQNGPMKSLLESCQNKKNAIFESLDNQTVSGKFSLCVVRASENGLWAVLHVSFSCPMDHFASLEVQKLLLGLKWVELSHFYVPGIKLQNWPFCNSVYAHFEPVGDSNPHLCGTSQVSINSKWAHEVAPRKLVEEKNWHFWITR